MVSNLYRLHNLESIKVNIHEYLFLGVETPKPETNPAAAVANKSPEQTVTGL